MPESAQFPPPTAFFSQIKIEALPPLDRAHYQTMTRQFEAALASYEEVLGDPGIRAVNLVGLGALTRYLKLAIGVKGDFKRPQSVLSQISARVDAPDHLRLMLGDWVQALKQYEKSDPLKSSDLPTARQILNEGKLAMDFPSDRHGLIHYVTANAVLTRYISGKTPSSSDAAEAYYLLGVTEALLSTSFWISRQDHYLETSIRLAPETSFAKKAYALLEENLIAGYTGSGGTHIPDDVRNLLRELKELIKGTKKEG